MYDRECSGEPRDRRESLELSKVHIGLETYRVTENEMQVHLRARAASPTTVSIRISFSV